MPSLLASGSRPCDPSLGPNKRIPSASGTFLAEMSPTYHRCPCVVSDGYAGSSHGSDPSTGPLAPCPCAVNYLRFGNVSDFARVAGSNIESAALRDVPPASARPPLRRRRQQRQEQLFASDAEEAAVKRVAKAQRQRIRRLDETYRAAERARNAQRQRRLRANDEYRACEVFRNRLRRLRKSQNGFNRGRVRYGTFEELSWLRDGFSEEEWNSLKNMWPPATKRTRRCCYGNDVSASGGSSRIWPPGSSATVPFIPGSRSSTNEVDWLVPSCWPPVPADEPRCWVLVSVPHTTLTAASSTTLADLLSSDKALCVLPDGGLVPANEAQLNLWLPVR